MSASAGSSSQNQPQPQAGQGSAQVQVQLRAPQGKLGRRQLAKGAWRGGPNSRGADVAAAAGAGEDAALRLLVQYLAVDGKERGGGGERVEEEGVKRREREIGRNVAGLVGRGVEELGAGAENARRQDLRYVNS